MSSADRLPMLLRNMRLLEAAQLANDLGTEDSTLLALARACTHYHNWIVASDLGDTSSLRKGLDAAALSTLTSALGAFDKLYAIPNEGPPYAHFVASFEAMAHGDGERMIHEVEKVVSMRPRTWKGAAWDDISNYLAAINGDVPPDSVFQTGVMSSYDMMQVLADVLTEALTLPQHAFTDVHRFAPATTLTQE